MKLPQLILGMLLLSIGQAQANEARHYFAVANESYSTSGLSALSYRYGYDFSNLLTVEVDHSVTDLTAATGGLQTIDSVTNIMLHFNQRYESINTYFAIGYAQAEMTQTTPAGESSFGGYSYGVGIELYGSKNTAVTFSWMKRIVMDSANSVEELTSTQVGLIHHFDWGKTVSRY